MTTVSVDNQKVQITLGPNESVTIPSSETWLKPRITAGLADGIGATVRVEFDGQLVARVAEEATPEARTVEFQSLPGGATIQETSFGAAVVTAFVDG